MFDGLERATNLRMRIGTWNLAGRWTPSHEAFLMRLDCDVWLLTEVSDRLVLPGYIGHTTTQRMAAGRRWAGVFSRVGLEPLEAPHPASAFAIINELTVCSSVLPWRTCGKREPWVGQTHVDKTAHALGTLLESLPRSGLVWGGDWNHALEGPESAGSKGGRRHLLNAVAELGLQVPTACLPNRIEGLVSIDHISVGLNVDAPLTRRIVASDGDRWLSDHDAYVMDM